MIYINKILEVISNIFTKVIDYLKDNFVGIIMTIFLVWLLFYIGKCNVSDSANISENIKKADSNINNLNLKNTLYKDSINIMTEMLAESQHEIASLKQKLYTQRNSTQVSKSSYYNKLSKDIQVSQSISKTDSVYTVQRDTTCDNYVEDLEKEKTIADSIINQQEIALKNYQLKVNYQDSFSSNLNSIINENKKVREQLELALKKEKRKRFSLTTGVGPVLTPKGDINGGLSLILGYNIFKF